jgi:hypothetical protein
MATFTVTPTSSTFNVQLGENTAAAAASAAEAATSQIVEVTGTTRTLLLSDLGKTLHCTNVAGCVITVPPSLGLPDGGLIQIAQMAAGAVQIVPGSGVTINSEGNLDETRDQYAHVIVQQAGTDNYTLYGALA